MSGGRLVLVVLSAIGVALAFPPWDVALASWIALAPFLWVVTDLAPLRAASAGLLWGTLHTWAIGWWVPVAIANYWGQPAWFGASFALLASIVFVGSYVAAFASVAAWTAKRCRGVTRIVLLSSLWVGFELARARLLTGDPWLLSGYGLVPYESVSQLADIGGVHALSFLLVAVNACIAEIPRAFPHGSHAALRPVLLAGALLALSIGYGSVRLAGELPVEPARRIALVQGNVDVETQWSSELQDVALARYLELSRDAAMRWRPELLVWPESAVTAFLAQEPQMRSAIGDMLATTGAALIAGGPHVEGSPPDALYFNSAFLLDARGRIRTRYDKARLLPFAEYFPLRSIVLLRRHFERVRTFTPGSGDVVLATAVGKVGIAICFEAIFPELVLEQVRRGAEILVNLSNDAWLGWGPGPEQHLRMVRLRAIENRRWLVRATTTGVSAIVDPFGRVVAQVPAGESGALGGTVVPLQGVSPYQRLGDLFAYVCVAVGAVGVSILAAVSPARARRKPIPRPTAERSDAEGSDAQTS